MLELARCPPLIRPTGCRAVSVMAPSIALMQSQQWEQQAAALHALVTHRPAGTRVAVVLDAVLEHGDPTAAGADLCNALFDDPRAVDEARREVADWVHQLDALDGPAGVLSLLDPDYPSQLRATPDAPPFLFYRGDLSVLGRDGVSVVGTRDVSRDGRARAKEAAEAVAQAGLCVLSGLARGVDAVAHEATLAAGGTPVGVIATPVTGPYTPATNRALHEQVAQAGCLVSQFPPGTHVHKASFLQRNAVMSALGIASILVEAGESSGTRHQARAAMSHGRPVILTRDIVDGTQWGRDLVSMPSVRVISTRSEMHQAISEVRALGGHTIGQLVTSVLE